MKKYLYFLIFLSIISCKENNQEKTVNSFRGKKIILPYRQSPKIKIATFVDASCGTCVKELPWWNQFLSKFDDKVDLFCYYNDSSATKLLNDLDSVFFKEKNFIIYDTNNIFLVKNNLLMLNKIHQTFLVDKNNKVLLVGNPIYDNDLKQLYKKIISEQLK